MNRRYNVRKPARFRCPECESASIRSHPRSQTCHCNNCHYTGGYDLFRPSNQPDRTPPPKKEKYVGIKAGIITIGRGSVWGAELV